MLRTCHHLRFSLEAGGESVLRSALPWPLHSTLFHYELHQLFASNFNLQSTTVSLYRIIVRARRDHACWLSRDSDFVRFWDNNTHLSLQHRRLGLPGQRMEYLKEVILARIHKASASNKLLEADIFMAYAVDFICHVYNVPHPRYWVFDENDVDIVQLEALFCAIAFLYGMQRDFRRVSALVTPPSCAFSTVLRYDFTASPEVPHFLLWVKRDYINFRRIIPLDLIDEHEGDATADLIDYSSSTPRAAVLCWEVIRGEFSAWAAWMEADDLRCNRTNGTSLSEICGTTECICCDGWIIGKDTQNSSKPLKCHARVLHQFARRKLLFIQSQVWPSVMSELLDDGLNGALVMFEPVKRAMLALMLHFVRCGELRCGVLLAQQLAHIYPTEPLCWLVIALLHHVFRDFSSDSNIENMVRRCYSRVCLLIEQRNNSSDLVHKAWALYGLVLLGDISTVDAMNFERSVGGPFLEGLRWRLRYRSDQRHGPLSSLSLIVTIVLDDYWRQAARILHKLINALNHSFLCDDADVEAAQFMRILPNSDSNNRMLSSSISVQKLKTRLKTVETNIAMLEPLCYPKANLL